MITHHNVLDLNPKVLNRLDEAEGSFEAIGCIFQ